MGVGDLFSVGTAPNPPSKNTSTAERTHLAKYVGYEVGRSTVNRGRSLVPFYPKRPSVCQIHPEDYPNAQLAVFSLNDDSGKELVGGFKKGLGDWVSMIVAERTAENTNPTVDSEIVYLKSSGADLFMSFVGFRLAVQSVKKVTELGWKPVYFQDGAAQQIASALEYADGVISAGFIKEPNDPAWKDDAGAKEYVAFMDKYAPSIDKTSSGAVWGYAL